MRGARAELVYERELIEKARASREAFGLLYDRYAGSIYRYAYARTGSHHDAEDVTAEVFRRALEHLDRYEWRGGPFGAWLSSIAAHLVIDRHRRARPQSSIDEALELPDNDPLPERVALDREEAGSLWAAVATLPSDQRRAVVLRFSRGLKGREIAEVMGRSEGSVKQLLYRAVVTLREKVKLGVADG
ncbi:MAG: sigma-70 family RNA polymerase sigma factor [Chloroflexota bacterium]|nr:MAG: sigma-70 family RNA polymerase sigma factor [Chloroflexota bacterium]